MARSGPPRRGRIAFGDGPADRPVGSDALAAGGQSHPWPWSTQATAGNAEGLPGRRPPAPAVRRLDTGLVPRPRPALLRGGCEAGVQRVVAVLSFVAFAAFTVTTPVGGRVARAVDLALVNQQADESADDDAEEVAGPSFPTDRRRERQLDQVRRLVAEGRWSDVATLADGILESDQDFFVRPAAGDATWRSVKSEAVRILAGLPDAGRKAYELQFRTRAERALAKAVADNDQAAIVAVARRWFLTPAGRQATLLAALEALEGGQPLAASVWLDRLAATPESSALEPTLSVLRSTALWRAGEKSVAAAVLDASRAARRGDDRRAPPLRFGGRDVPFDYAPGTAGEWLESAIGQPPAAAGRREREWWLPRGDAARNALVEASRPLLAPRYRVPLTRHPEESRLLERRRRQAADRDQVQWPAGLPIAVDGRLVVRSTLGLMAIDFVTGKRVWLQPAGTTTSFLETPDEVVDGFDGSAREELPASVREAFEDAARGGLASDGRLVFSVEPDPQAIAADQGRLQARFDGLGAPDVRGGNALVAYEIEGRGREVWRLPRGPGERTAAGEPAPPGGNREAGGRGHYLGAPLPLGEQLFVIVEDRGEIRLDVLDGASGATLWSQPLTVLDEELGFDGAVARQRRNAGLSPSYAEGVLVCPTGAGAVVAVDLANRTLLWAYAYAARADVAAAQQLPNGLRIRRGGINARILVNGQLQVGGQAPSRPTGWRDAGAIIAEGRIVLTPPDSEELHCIDLRSGSVVWRKAREDAVHVAGVSGGGVIVVGRHAVDVLAVADGTSRLAAPVSLGSAAPSGRGIVAGDHVFLPLDTPEVIDIDLVAGEVVGRSPARGGSVPGNLVAYRGEVISQGVDSIDVFHQSDALADRLQTADGRGRAALWGAELALDRGDIVGGLAALVAAREGDPTRIPTAVVDDALSFALTRDFAAAAPLWRQRLAAADAPPVDPAAFARQLRVAADGYLNAGDWANGWWVCREAIAGALDPAATPATGLVEDPGDRRLSVAGPRWLHGRLARILAAAPAPLRDEIDRHVAASLGAIAADPDPVIRTARLENFLGVFGAHPAAVAAQRALVDTLRERLAAPGTGGAGGTGDTARGLALRAELVSPSSASMGLPPIDSRRAWPLGKVVEQRSAVRGGEQVRQVRLMALPVNDSGAGAFPGLRLWYDMNQPRLFAVDGAGRQLGDLLERSTRQIGMQINPLIFEAATVGRIVVIRTGPVATAFELSGDPAIANRRLWSLAERSALAAELPLINVGRTIGRVVRAGAVPLGLQVVEPDMAAAREEVQLGPVSPRGIAVRIGTTVELHDPISGAVVWERRRLPAGVELFGDDEVIVAVPPTGAGVQVLAVADGRLLHELDLPPRHQRLATRGRRVVAIEPLPGGAQPTPGALHARVRLVAIDPLSRERTTLGEFSGTALAVQVGGDVLVLDRDGTLDLLDVAAGTARWRKRLPLGSTAPRSLQAQRWEDRFLVIVGRDPSAEEQATVQRAGMVMPLPQASLLGDAPLPTTGTVWAVAAEDGTPLWPAPASILQHALHPQQPAALPILVFARQIQSQRGAGSMRLSLLALDKRTGSAVCNDDGIEVQQPHLLMGCDVTADPEAHSIILGHGSGDMADRVLEFTGLPIAPRPPYQALGVQPPPLDLRGSLQRLLERALIPDGGP